MPAAAHNDISETSAGPYEESWEPKIAKKIQGMVEAVEKDNPDGEYPFPFCMVALVGMPGSGKKISSFILANILENYGIETFVMSQSGFHYPIEYLKTFPDAEEIIYRRGAPDTFDPLALSRDLRRIRGDDDGMSVYSSHSHQEESHVISLPGFDHAKGDPEPDKATFDRLRHKVVLCEGLYLLHDSDGWEDVASLFDLKVFMDSDIDNCIERLKIRNQCIPGYTPDEIAIRCETVDRVNAMTVSKSKHRADIIVESISKPIQSSEFPDLPTAQETALKKLAQTDVDGAEHRRQNSDWTMDITSITRGNLNMRSRSNTMISEASEPPPPPASQYVGTWEPQQGKIILERLEKVASDPKKLPYMVALIGTPGSGKSVSSFMLASILEDQGYPTMICPHDGYHYPIEYLKTFPDADDFLYRRGAPDTFDPRGLLRDLDRIKNGEEELIKLPAFDHAKADPEPDTHIFDRNHHKIVLCEGLYLLHDQDGWEDIASMFDYSIFMNSDVDVCIERLKIRNQCIPGYSPEEIEVRCEAVDRVNALTVMRSKARADVVVDSLAVKK